VATKRTIWLEDSTATERLGRVLAGCLPAARPFQCLLLEGELGAGKTTLVRGLVMALPGSEEAEVSSPSFNLLNLYPTAPPIAHFDLYRLEGQPPDETLLECIAAGEHLLAIEWAQFLPREAWPTSYVRIRWRKAASGRSIEIVAVGPATHEYWAAICAALAESFTLNRIPCVNED